MTDEIYLGELEMTAEQFKDMDWENDLPARQSAAREANAHLRLVIGKAKRVFAWESKEYEDIGWQEEGLGYVAKPTHEARLLCIRKVEK